MIMQRHHDARVKTVVSYHGKPYLGETALVLEYMVEVLADMRVDRDQELEKEL